MTNWTTYGEYLLHLQKYKPRKDPLVTEIRQQLQVEDKEREENMKRLELVGQRFGKLKVLSFAGVRGKAKGTYWMCECECGTKRAIKGAYLKSGNTKSCMKCAHRLELTGQRFGHWTVLSNAGRKRNKSDGKWLSHWLCRCDCGHCGGIERVVRGTSLTSGRSTSCGAPELKITHGESGQKRTPEYRAWGSMIERCCNPQTTGYSNYGGRGITICPRWRNSYEDFLEDMGRKPFPPSDYHLDRIDSNGNYEPSNCRWAPYWKQENRRPSGALETILGKLSDVDLEKVIAEKERREKQKEFRDQQKSLAAINGFIN